MPGLKLIPRSTQRDEPWANGAGTTTVIFREPDSAQWRIRVSVAKVETAGPFSELAATRRTLVPLDAAITLRFPDGRELHAVRLGRLLFDGVPAPTGLLPEGPTRDFNLMLRGRARGEALPRTLVDRMLLPPEAGTRWLVYLDSGHATLRAGDAAPAPLAAGDAAIVIPDAGSGRVVLAGAGEIVLVKLYA
ncbi:MAG: HutD family protein [Rhodanobacteraceae bacterium]|nr:MAG: HutD family protein [Rhodanobacteraceae bacterium]